VPWVLRLTASLLLSPLPLTLGAPPLLAQARSHFEDFEDFDIDTVERVDHDLFSGDSASVAIVAEGPGGSKCLRFGMSREDPDGLQHSAYVRFRIPEDRGAESLAAPGADSPWVLQWRWKIQDTRSSGGVLLHVRVGDTHSRGCYSHHLFTDPHGSCDVRELEWATERKTIAELEPLVGEPFPSHRPGSGQIEVVLALSWPRRQVVWLDDVAFGPADAVPSAGGAPAEPQGLIAREVAIGGFAAQLFPAAPPVLFLPNRAQHLSYAYQWRREGFVDRASDLRLDRIGGGSGGICLDLDNDRDRDIVVVRDGLPGFEFWENDGWDRFVLRDPVAGAPWRRDTYQIAPGDFDEDGRVDLWVVSPTGPNSLLMGRRGFAFEALETIPFEHIPDSTRAIAETTLRNNYSATVADFDGDGHADVLAPGRGGETGATVLLFGTGRGTFDRIDLLDHWREDAPRSLTIHPDVPPSRVEAYASIEGAAAADLDNDGDLDLVIARDYTVNDRPAPNEILMNDGHGAFLPCDTAWMRTSTGRTEAVIPADFDNDGWIDLYEVNHGYNRHLRNREGTGLDDVTSDSPFQDADYSAMALAADFEPDGRLDIVLFEATNPRPHQTMRNTSHAGHWIRVRVNGIESGTEAVGAVVRLFEPGGAGDPNRLIGYQQHLHGMAYPATNNSSLHFGLGDRETCDIEVTYPSRVVRRVLDASAGQTHTVWEIRPGPVGVIDRAISSRAWLREQLRARGVVVSFAILVALSALAAGVAEHFPMRGRAVVAVLAAAVAVVAILAAIPGGLGGALLAVAAAGVGAAQTSRLVFRSLLPPQSEERGWHELLQLLGTSKSHWAKNLSSIARTAQTVLADERSGRVPALRSQLREHAHRFLREDFARFEAACSRAGALLRADRESSALAIRMRDELRALRKELGRLDSGENLSRAAALADSVRLTGIALLGRAENRECHETHEVLRVIQECADATLGGAGTMLVRDVPEALVVVDLGDLRVLVTNLLRNAAEASSPSPVTLTITARIETDDWILTLSDDGPGVPSHLVPDLFRDGRSEKGADRGTGLGEAARLAATMFGNLTLANAGRDGGGAVFELALRRARSASREGSP